MSAALAKPARGPRQTVAGHRRLQSAAAGSLPWIATLTPAELALAGRHGIRPVTTLVTAAVRIAHEAETRTVKGWRDALERMQGEAKAAGADAVVDARLHSAPLSANAVEYRLTGTAIRIGSAPAGKAPVITTVSLPQFTMLMQAGIVPLGMAIGAFSKTYRAQGKAAHRFRRFHGVASNRLDGLSHLWEGVQRKAFESLERDAEAQGGSVFVHSAHLELVPREAGTIVGRCIALGTIVDAGAPGDFTRTIRPVVDMRDGDSPLKAVHSRHSPGNGSGEL